MKPRNKEKRSLEKTAIVEKKEKDAMVKIKERVSKQFRAEGIVKKRKSKKKKKVHPRV